MNNDEINRLQAQIDALQEQLSVMRGDAEPERSSRRGMLKLAAGAAVGAVAGGMALGANPALAVGIVAPHEHFYSISPTRVYDSRWTGAQSSILSSRLGRLNPNTGRSVDLGRGRERRPHPEVRGARSPGRPGRCLVPAGRAQYA